MRRSISFSFSLTLVLAFVASDATAQRMLNALPRGNTEQSPKLRQLSVPASQARSIATTLSLRYQDIPGVQISPDAKNETLVVMAPEKTQQKIAQDVQTLLNQGHVRMASAQSEPVQIRLTNITWHEFEGTLQGATNGPMPVTTSNNGKRSSYHFTTASLKGATVEVDRVNNLVTVQAPRSMMSAWQKLIAAIDTKPAIGGVTKLMRLENAEPAPIQKAVRLLRRLNNNGNSVAAPADNDSPFRNAVFQLPAGDDAGQPPAEDTPADDVAGPKDGGSGVIGETEIQFIPEMGQIIIKGNKRDVARVMEVIKQIELTALETQPEIEVVTLEHADSNAVATLITQLYDDVLSARQGDVNITSLDSPNALLLIGRKEAIAALKDLITKIDQPVDAASRLRVFRLQNASALDAETTIRDFFTDRPGSNDDVRPGVGPRVRVLADYRTNSLIVSASPRDMLEVTRLVNQLDVQEIPAQHTLKIFPLNNASAEVLAPTLQTAITGETDAGDGNATLPSTTLSIVAVEGDRTVDSGILSGASVTADTGANAIVVRAPASSMPLIGELIRQLDKSPGIDSLVKVFTIKNGDATQLTTALTTLFGDEAATTGTSIGAGNTAGLPPATAAGESSLVPLRFSPDVRTNSIITSGAAEDLEVVESILLRLDSEGFAERITEVIWLRHNDATQIAEAITNYVNARQQSQTAISQYQQGLGPFDLLDRDVIAVPEINSNSLLLSVSPRLYEEVRRLIDRLDRRRPMVLIKVVIAEVNLDDVFEVGGEVGLQDSLVFNRGLAVNAIPGANSAGAPGFNFNNAGTTNVNGSARETLAAAGVTSFGVGTTNPSIGYGGFVLNAASDSISLLLRTLQEANRLQVLSRPQIMTMDNTQALVRVGRQVARVTGIVNNGVNGTTVGTEDVDVGLILGVRPRVGADGLILMEVDATRSDRDPGNGTLVPTGDGSVVFIDDLLDTTAQSTLTAYSGQTVIFGGLIQKSRSNFSRRVPIIADIPLIGNLFKYDQESETRSELLIIMTPMLITGDQDLDYVKQVESSRMSWCLADVVEAHGDVGLSGGHGLWGPAIGPTIYPDVTPTVEREVIISDEPVGTGNAPAPHQPLMHSPMIDSPARPAVNPIDLPGPAGPLPGPAAAGSASGASHSPTDFRFPALPNGAGHLAPVNVEVPPSVQRPNRVTDAPVTGQLYPTTANIPVPSATQVGWWETQNVSTAASKPQPKRLGETKIAADAEQTIPSISPRAWIR